VIGKSDEVLQQLKPSTYQTHFHNQLTRSLIALPLAFIPCLAVYKRPGEDFRKSHFLKASCYEV